MSDDPKGIAAEALRRWLDELYAAFNVRQLDTLLAVMAPDVDWANGMEGGRLTGRAELRAYWTRQWATIDPRVTPVRVTNDARGRALVDVHQVVRDLTGTVIVDQMIRHVYELRDGKVARMEIEASPLRRDDRRGDGGR